MFKTKTKLVSSNATTTPKPLKLNNVPINVVTTITIHNSITKTTSVKRKKFDKTKGAED
jgi:hypothetical protein